MAGARLLIFAVFVCEVDMANGILTEHDPNFDLAGGNEVKKTFDQVSVFLRIILIARDIIPLHLAV
jgi:hypothetical protein